MTFEQNTNHLNRHPNITFAFNYCNRLSRSKKKETPLSDEREIRGKKRETKRRETEKEREKEKRREMLMKKMGTVRSSTHHYHFSRKSFSFPE